MITFVTGNKNKLAEVQKLLGSAITSHDVDLPELQGSYTEIIEHKAAGAAAQIEGPVIVEDTALQFNAWGELPGPYIKWFQKQFGPEGLPGLLDNYDKAAEAVCTVGYCEGPGQPVKVFQGRTLGKIVPSRGHKIFGWDSCFEPAGFSETYAEMDKEIKNKISHRAKAMAALKEFLDSKGSN